MKKRPRKKTGDTKQPSPAGGFSDRVWGLVVPAVLAVFTLILFGKFLFSSGMLFGTDTLPMGYAARKAFTDLWKASGSLPLWNPFFLGGIPMVDGLVGGDMFYPTTLLQRFIPVHRVLGLKLVIHVFLAGWFFYLYARRNGTGRGPALIAGTGYAFAPYLISLIYAGHDGKLFVTALAPLGFLTLDRLLEKGKFLDMIFFGTSIALMIYTAHLQLAFFACGAFGLRFVWKSVEAWRRNERSHVLRVTGLFVGAALLGASIGAVQTYPAYQYTNTFSPRAGGVTYEFATSWSIHWEEAVSFLVPEFGHYLDFYWGENPFKLNCESPGFLMGLLVIAGFFRIRKDRELLFWYVLLAITLIYALGAETPLFHIIYAVVPKFFRAPSTILFLFSFASALISARVLDAWFRGEGRSALLRGATVTAGILLLMLAATAGGEGFFRAWGDIVRGGMPEKSLQTAIANIPELQASAVLLLLLGGAFVGLLEMGRRSGWPIEAIAIGGAALVFLGDLKVDRDFVKTVSLTNYIREDANIRAMGNESEPFRALSLSQNFRDNTFGAFGIEAAGGFFDNKIRTYDELTSGSNLQNLNILSMVNVKYLLLPAPGMDHPSFVETSRERDILYRNVDVLPRAFLVEDFIVDTPTALLAQMTVPNVDFTRALFLEETPGYDPPGSGFSTSKGVEWTEQGPNRYALRVTTERPAMLFVSNNWLPHWKAEVDGEPVKLFRANYTFQAVELPPGSHAVSIEYRSKPYEQARAVTLGAIVFALAGGSGTWLRGRRKESAA